MASLEKTIVLQWVPTHCGVPDQSKPVLVPLQPCFPQVLDECYPDFRNGPKRRAVVEFRLATRHDSLRNHLDRT
ncbi:hypothetical protein TNCV_4608121 [Trichonephila clavipes]|nr:hypothetical protein TNCV_4608121 [Trichonephila clavipes]